MIEAVDTTEFPYLAELTKGIIDPTFDFAASFETGLDIVVEGPALSIKSDVSQLLCRSTS